MDEKNNEEINLKLEDNLAINDTYTILLNRKIGNGSFGQIYQCLNVKTNEIYACKLESKNELNPQLYHESKIMNIMKNCTGFPTCYSFCYTDQDKIIIMDYLGANLETIKNRLPEKKFSMKTSLMIMIQCLERLKTLHDKGIIHRDMKPENFVIGRKNKERTIYLIDFGLSKKYINDNNIHISMKTDRNMIGTVRYISMNTHQGFEQSRRDDLESLIYIIIYFIKGELPWQNIKYKSKSERYNKIFEIKKKTTEKGGELCENLPSEIQTILDYILGLDFTEKPNYSLLKDAVEIILAKLNYTNDLQFDWYNLEFLKNLYKSPPIIENNQKNSSKNKDNDNKEINNDINKNNIKINNKLDINKSHRNSVICNRIRQNKSISKAQNYMTEINKYKSPKIMRKSVIQDNNYQNKKWDEIFNTKVNQPNIKRKSNNVIPRIIKK